MTFNNPVVLIRGGGDLATGVGARLFRSGIKVVITELAQPMAVRRMVSFAQTVYSGIHSVEEIMSKKVDDITQIDACLAESVVPVIVDPEAEIAEQIKPIVIVDSRMIKVPPKPHKYQPELMIGLGPGFTAGDNADAVVETQRGHYLGRVYWHGPAADDSGTPDPVENHESDRVLRAPIDGCIISDRVIGDHVTRDEIILSVGTAQVKAGFDGIIRGLIYDGLWVSRNQKIGDVDPRDDRQYCFLISDKSLSVGGGVLEAILHKPAIRSRLWLD